MTETQKNISWQKALALIVVAVVITYLGLQGMTNKRIENLTVDLQLRITEQHALLATISEITSRNGADSVTEAIVRDCSSGERTRFDELLGRLNTGLSMTELSELERLFGRCGSFSAERKSAMVARLTREIEVYETYINLLKNVRSESDIEPYKVESWKNLVAEEKKQSELFGKLVTLQGSIIDTLLSGKKIDSAEITAILSDVKETQETLLVANKQAAQLRSELISL